jgi:hypothetical protein
VTIRLPVSEDPLLPVEANLWDMEPPGLFPANQNSYWGTYRRVFGEQLQTLVNMLDQFYLNMSPLTVNADDMNEWEYQMGLPTDPTKDLEARRIVVMNYLHYGAFTRTWRKSIVEDFIRVTLGTPIMLFPEGVALVSAGVPLHGESVDDLTTLYSIVEHVETFTYDVRINSRYTVDEVGLNRALRRITPCSINFTVTYVATIDPYWGGVPDYWGEAGAYWGTFSP